MNYYNVSEIIVKQDNRNSDIINITEGVKQGGVLSPYLFYFFINDLLDECTGSELGWKIKNLTYQLLPFAAIAL